MIYGAWMIYGVFLFDDVVLIDVVLIGEGRGWWMSSFRFV